MKCFILIFAWCILKACAHTCIAIRTHDERGSQDQGMCVTLWVEHVLTLIVAIFSRSYSDFESII